MTPEQSMLNATMLGYVAGLAWGEHPEGPARNPYACVQPEAYNYWQHGFEQGSNQRAQCGVFDPLPPEPLRCVIIQESEQATQEFWRVWHEEVCKSN